MKWIRYYGIFFHSVITIFANQKQEMKFFLRALKSFKLLTALAVSLYLLTVFEAKAQQFMSQKELLDTLPGSQVSGIWDKDNKSKWTQAYSDNDGSKKGLVAGIWKKKEKYQSTWYVEGNQWCEKWDSGETCMKFVRIGPKQLLMYKDGVPSKNFWIIK